MSTFFVGPPALELRRSTFFAASFSAAPVRTLVLALAALASCQAAERPAARPSAPFAELEARFPEAHLARGRTVYMRQCVTCHQTDGQGTGRAIPPLVDHVPKIAAQKLGKAYLARLGLYGLNGKIEVNGATYYNLMPAQGTLLADEDVAGAINYVLTQWGHDAGIEADQLLHAEDVAHERATPRTAAQNLLFRRQALPGVVTPP